jgi:imidazolonepropionase-like amidohydrolase
MHESGASMGASFPKPSVELQRAIITAAHAAGLVAVAHALALTDTLEILSAGIDGLTHTFYDAPHTPELLAAYAASGAWVNPTLAAVGSLTTEGKAYAERFAHDERVQTLIGKAERERLCMCMDFRTAESKVQYAYDTVKALKAAGVPVIV